MGMEAMTAMHTEVMVTEEGVDMILTEEEVDMDLPLDTLTEEAMTPRQTEVMLLTEEVDMDLPLHTLTEEVNMDLPLVDPLTQQEAMTPKHHPDMMDSHTQQEAMTPKHTEMVLLTEEVDTELPLDTLREEAMDRLTEQPVMVHLTVKRSNSSHHSTSMFSIVVPIGTNQHFLPH